MTKSALPIAPSRPFQLFVTEAHVQWFGFFLWHFGSSPDTPESGTLLQSRIAHGIRLLVLRVGFST